MGRRYGRQERVGLYLPPSWVSILRREAEKEGMPLSAYIKVFLVAPWIREIKKKEGR